MKVHLLWFAFLGSDTLFLTERFTDGSSRMEGFSFESGGAMKKGTHTHNVHP
jgi:hypothetical protein